MKKNNNDLSSIVNDILDSYDSFEPKIHHFHQTPLPSREVIAEIIDDFFGIIFPGYFWKEKPQTEGIPYLVGHKINGLSQKLSEQIYRSIIHDCKQSKSECKKCLKYSIATTREILSSVPEIRKILAGDVQAAYDGDPASQGRDEIIFSYPCLLAITIFRIAHKLWLLKVPLIPRIMTEYAHSKTGIDIHPGATIGKNFFIDHGTGVVIGETTEIGNNVKIYQGVTLGALSFPKDERGNIIRGEKRHPTIEDNTVIYAHATILGGKTVIGEGAVIGGNVWITRSVPPYTKILMDTPSCKVSKLSRHDK